jgi:hypothetical protein
LASAVLALQQLTQHLGRGDAAFECDHLDAAPQCRRHVDGEARGVDRRLGGNLLSARQYTSKDLWVQVKPTVRSVQSDEGVFIFDDTIQEKAWTDESELMCWHYDHVSGRNVRGLNLLNALYNSNGASIPVAFELVKKPIQYSDIKTRKPRRKSDVTKNELMRPDDSNLRQQPTEVSFCVD